MVALLDVVEGARCVIEVVMTPHPQRVVNIVQGLVHNHVCVIQCHVKERKVCRVLK